MSSRLRRPIPTIGRDLVMKTARSGRRARTHADALRQEELFRAHRERFEARWTTPIVVLEFESGLPHQEGAARARLDRRTLQFATNSDERRNERRGK
jgi:hypothetical protein